MYFHPQKLDRNTIPIFPYLNRVEKLDFSCHQISIKDFVSSACFCLFKHNTLCHSRAGGNDKKGCDFYALILRSTTIIPAGVMPGMRVRSAMFSGRVAVNFSTNSLVSPGRPEYTKSDGIFNSASRL